MIPQKELLYGTYDLNVFLNEESPDVSRRHPIKINRFENEPSQTHGFGLEDTLYGRDTQSRSGSRKRSRAELPAIIRTTAKLPIVRANMEDNNGALLFADSQYPVSYDVHKDGSHLHRVAYYNASDKPNADVQLRPRRSIAFSQRPNNASDTTHGKLLDNGTENLSWSNAIFELVIQLASHMWQFCMINAFRGFRAGGGTSFVWKDRCYYAVTNNEDASSVAPEKYSFRKDSEQQLLRQSDPNLGHFPARNSINLHNDWMVIAPSSLSAADLKSAEDIPRHAPKRQQADSDGAWRTASHYSSGYNSHIAGSDSQPGTSSATRKRVRKAHLAGGRCLRPCSCSSLRSSSHSRRRSPQSNRLNNCHPKSNSLHNQLDTDHDNLSLCPSSSSQRESRSPQRPLKRRKSWQGQHYREKKHVDPWATNSLTVTTAKSAQHTPVKAIYNDAGVDFDAVALTKFRPKFAFASRSPLSADARRYQIRQRREERRADASIQKVNDQLKDMIREGRKALGSRVSVDVGIDDKDW